MSFAQKTKRPPFLRLLSFSHLFPCGQEADIHVFFAVGPPQQLGNFRGLHGVVDAVIRVLEEDHHLENCLPIHIYWIYINIMR